MEVVQILKQKAIQASTTAYSLMMAGPLIVFLIFVPSVLTGHQLPLFSVIFVFSLTKRLHITAIFFVLRCFTNSFDTFTSLQRIQVL